MHPRSTEPSDAQSFAVRTMAPPVPATRSPRALPILLAVVAVAAQASFLWAGALAVVFAAGHP